jgi:hypothetical protein
MKNSYPEKPPLVHDDANPALFRRHRDHPRISVRDDDPCELLIQI